MIDKDDLEISTFRVLDRLDKMDHKLDRLLTMNEVDGEQSFDAVQVKKMLHISDATLWRYCKKGLKCRRGLHGKRTFRLKDIREFVYGK